MGGKRVHAQTHFGWQALRLEAGVSCSKEEPQELPAAEQGANTGEEHGESAVGNMRGTIEIFFFRRGCSQWAESTHTVPDTIEHTHRLTEAGAQPPGR